MTYGQCRDFILKLINQYSVAGTNVDPSYNNQQDYLNRIPQIINDAMVEISTTVKKIPVTLNLTTLEGEDLGKSVRYELPENFYQFRSGDIVKTDDGRVLHTNYYTIYGKKYLVIPKKEVDDYSLTYYRYPMLLDENPDEDDELDNVLEVHQAIPYYVASMIVSYDDSFLCSLFANKYNDKLQLMHDGISAEVHPIVDAYSF